MFSLTPILEGVGVLEEAGIRGETVDGLIRTALKKKGDGEIQISNCIRSKKKED